MEINQNVKGNYPLLNSIAYNNTDMVQLLIEYAKGNKIKLEINERNKDKNYPILLAIYSNNIVIVKIIDGIR